MPLKRPPRLDTDTRLLPSSQRGSLLSKCSPRPHYSHVENFSKIRSRTLHTTEFENVHRRADLQSRWEVMASLLGVFTRRTRRLGVLSTMAASDSFPIYVRSVSFHGQDYDDLEAGSEVWYLDERGDCW